MYVRTCQSHLGMSIVITLRNLFHEDINGERNLEGDDTSWRWKMRRTAGPS